MLLHSSCIVAHVVFLSFTSLQGQVAAIYNTFWNSVVKVASNLQGK